MAEPQFETMEIVRAVKVGERTWTPADRIVPADAAAEIIKQGAGFVLIPGMTLTQVHEKTLALQQQEQAKGKAPAAAAATATQSK